ncbi:MAG: DUF2911 domain-containing protein [Balneolales bacterium]
MKPFNTLLLIVILITSFAISVSAQDAPEHRKSPVVIEHTTVGDTYMKVVYGQPYKRNRAIFGDLVPFNEVWRAGANEATEITLTGDINFNGETLKAGNYSLLAIPNQDNWTIVVSSQLGKWGAYSYDENMDVLRTDVPVTSLDEPSEAFTIQFAEDGSALSMMWDRTLVSIPIEVK